MAAAICATASCGIGVTEHLAASTGSADGGDHAEAKAERQPDAGRDATDSGADMAKDAAADMAKDAAADMAKDAAIDVAIDGADGPGTEVAPDIAEEHPDDAMPDMADDRAGDVNEGGSDGDTGGGPCDRNQTFGPPVLVPGLNSVSANILSAQFSPDELTAYLGMFHGSQLDLYTATRSSRSDPFGSPKPIGGINTLSEESSPSVTADGLTLYMQSTRSAAYALYVARRDSTSMDFSTPRELTELEVSGEGDPFVLPDGSALYFHSLRTGNYDLFRAKWNAGGVDAGGGFDTPQPLAINTDANEAVPVVSPDELTIYYLSFNTPNGNDGIWMATRFSVDEPFGAAGPLTGLTGKTPAVQPLWISPDACRLYYQDRDDNGGFLIYVAERPK